ncbi:MAG TPA: hypothetical protein VK504_18115, partial [Vicinamibacterales bacterium]|nr:hypothetical protein [Vicinamibacterales bacterium]
VMKYTHQTAPTQFVEANGIRFAYRRFGKANGVPLVDDRDRAYFGRDARGQDQVGYIDANTRAIFGRSYAAEPDVLVKELAGDEAIKAADTLLLTIPNQLGVDYNAHVLESILKYVAPELGWR